MGSEAYVFVVSDGPEDVVVKVLYCGLCHTDIHHVKNDLGHSKYPMVPGHEVVGEVEEVGAEVTKYRAGDVVGVGLVVGCCRECHPCKSSNEQYCGKKIWSYNDVYPDSKPTQGGFSSAMVVDQKFVVKIPAGLAPEQAAPLLCAGVTVYSPLKRFGLTSPGFRGGVLGLGGVGHMGVKIAKAMGHHVTVISSSDRKRAEAVDHLGADAFLVSSDPAAMAAAAGTLDYVIDTVPVHHPLEPYLALLGIDGKLVVGRDQPAAELRRPDAAAGEEVHHRELHREHGGDGGDASLLRGQGGDIADRGGEDGVRERGARQARAQRRPVPLRRRRRRQQCRRELRRLAENRDYSATPGCWRMC